jgi:redox-sensitive bicupin YhaK (pirin superfamily)
MPAQDEEIAPSFAHHDHADLPIVSADGANVRIVTGSIFGERSPVTTQSETLFADATLVPGATLPFDASTEERALYIVAGEIEISSDRFAAGQLLVFRPGDPITVAAGTEARVVLVGGAALEGPRYIWWNFVSSRKERIEQAKSEWKEPASTSFPATRSNSFRCRTDVRRGRLFAAASTRHSVCPRTVEERDESHS